ncbi:hypothetical protein BC826DRAFT_739786 [Russula brevipes]|nr:hypothetical protein BC826DRAFT_739786 [Russula brevipes]
MYSPCFCRPSFIAVSPNAYMAACELVLKIARNCIDLQCALDAGINPFFILYACADCGVPLPGYFSRELFWKHLDAIIGAQCWRGLGAERTAVQNGTGGGEVESQSESSSDEDFSQDNEDPERILKVLLALSLHIELPKQVKNSAKPVHELSIVITEDQWVAKCELGRLWYDANNLADKDVAPFAMLDTLTRVLPHWSGGILHIHTSDVQLLWGVCKDPPSGAWTIIRQICRSYHIELRAKWAALTSYEISLPADPVKRGALVPSRDENVVNSVVGELMKEGDNAGYRKMICHFMDGV